MALFGKARDINLFHTINSELIKDIIQTEVAYYKFALSQTRINVYGESSNKNYYEPMKIACLIDLQDQSWSSDDFGSDVNQMIGLSFLKNELETINLVPQVGDIVLYFNNFYEIDSRIENQYILGKDPDYSMAQETSEHGDSFSVIVNAHISRVEKLNLIPLRGNKYPQTVKSESA
tara:strand:+ start:630 stop:1157 length:528 start_codon:yes stop_codon:yes gene_type:complete